MRTPLAIPLLRSVKILSLPSSSKSKRHTRHSCQTRCDSARCSRGPASSPRKRRKTKRRRRSTRRINTVRPLLALTATVPHPRTATSIHDVRPVLIGETLDPALLGEVRDTSPIGTTEICVGIPVGHLVPHVGENAALVLETVQEAVRMQRAFIHGQGQTSRMTTLIEAAKGAEAPITGPKIVTRMTESVDTALAPAGVIQILTDHVEVHHPLVALMLMKVENL